MSRLAFFSGNSRIPDPAPSRSRTRVRSVRVRQGVKSTRMDAGSGGASPGGFVAVTTSRLRPRAPFGLRLVRRQRLDHRGVELRAVSGNREAFRHFSADRCPRIPILRAALQGSCRADAKLWYGFAVGARIGKGSSAGPAADQIRSQGRVGTTPAARCRDPWTGSRRADACQGGPGGEP